MVSQLNEAIRTLCCKSGWSFGVLWRVKSSDSMLLMFEDAYYEEQFRMLVEKMIHQVHLVGEGIIGQVAVTGQHRWIFLDASCEESSPVVPFENQAMFQTIAIISVSPQLVVQFGSIKKIPEELEFVDQAKRLFQQLQSLQGNFPYEKSLKAFSSEIYDPCANFTSVLPSNIPSSNYANTKFLDDNCPAPDRLAVPVIPGLTCATKYSNDILQKTTAFMNNTSLPLVNCEKASTDCQVTSVTPCMKVQQVLLQSNSSSTSSSALSSPSITTWSGDISSSTSMEDGLLCRTRIQRSQGISRTNLDTNYPCGNMFPNFQGNSILNPLYNTNRTLDVTRSKEYEAGKRKLADIQHTSPLNNFAEGSPFLPQLPKEPSTVGMCLADFGTTHTTLVDSSPIPISNMSQWTTPLKQVNKGSTTPLNDDLLQTFGIASSSDLVSSGAFSGTPVSDLPQVFQNSADCKTDTFWAVSNGKENSLNVPVQLPVDRDLFDGLRLLEPRQNQGLESWDNILLPERSGNPSNLRSCSPICASEFDTGSMTGPDKGFFPEVGLEQLLDVIASNANLEASHNSDDRLLMTSTTRNSNQIPLMGVSGISGSMNAMLSESNSQNFLYEPQKELLSKSLVSSWIDSSYSMKGEGVAVSRPKRSDEPVKHTKKRAKPGESARPRPKDRQQIQDRVKELREIVPNGTKCSIDALLDRTIKHMLFLESVAKYADKLKKIDEPKIIGEESGVVLKDNGDGGGTTWAFQLGGQTMVCPILVGDLNPPGQMLVEMLCEECGCFLEIADIIRGFGLTILKGVMEVLDDKIWARFVVEANRNVTRMDVFLSLVKLLQQTTSGTRFGSQPNKAIDSDVPVFSNYQQSAVPLPISLA